MSNCRSTECSTSEISIWIARFNAVLVSMTVAVLKAEKIRNLDSESGDVSRVRNVNISMIGREHL